MFVNKENKICPTWNDLYKCDDVFDLPWVSNDIHPVLRKIIDNMLLNKGNALDVGCGLGQVSRYLANVGFATTAIDISKEAIMLCEKLNDTGKKIEYHEANSITYYSEIKYNLIVDFLHIHDINRSDIDEYIKNIERLLSKQGVLIISTFLQDDMEKKYVKYRKSNYVDQNIYYYSITEIMDLLDGKYVIIDKENLAVGKNNEVYNSYLIVLKKI